MVFLLLHTTKVITCLVQCFINLHTVEKEGKWDPFNIDCGYKVLNNEVNSTYFVLNGASCVCEEIVSDFLNIML